MLPCYVTSVYWVQEAWSEQIATILNGEEADEIAVHFRNNCNAASSNGLSANSRCRPTPSPIA